MRIKVIRDLGKKLPKINPCDVLILTGVYSINNTFIGWVNSLDCQQVIVSDNRKFTNEEYNKYIYKPTKGKLELLVDSMCNIISEDSVIKIANTKKIPFDCTIHINGNIVKQIK